MAGMTLPIFIDGYPTDWLEDGKDDRWHVIAMVAIPDLELFNKFKSEMLQELTRFSKWQGKQSYRGKFIAAFRRAISTQPIWINVFAYQEKILRNARPTLSKLVGVGFSDEARRDGRPRMVHEFIDFDGYHRIDNIVNATLPLLLLSYLILDQHYFYEALFLKALGYEQFFTQVVCDTLSGDSPEKKDDSYETSLRNIVCRDGLEEEIFIVAREEKHPASYIVDNLAGWFGECIEQPVGHRAQQLSSIPNIDTLITWREVTLEGDKIKLESIFPRL